MSADNYLYGSTFVVTCLLARLYQPTIHHVCLSSCHCQVKNSILDGTRTSFFMNFGCACYPITGILHTCMFTSYFFKWNSWTLSVFEIFWIRPQLQGGWYNYTISFWISIIFGLRSFWAHRVGSYKLWYRINASRTFLRGFSTRKSYWFFIPAEYSSEQ